MSDYPFVAVFTQATGIHPSTARLLTIDAVTFDDSGRMGEDFHAVVNPGTVVDDPSPDVALAHGGESSPAQIAALVAFLASGLAKHATGTNIDVNGASYVR